MLNNEQLLELADCENCPIHKAGRRTPVFGHGNVDARVIACGIAPGREEEYRQVLFSGPSGDVLNALLSDDDVSIPREDIWITNALLCRPLNDNTDVNHIKQELKSCRPRLSAELQQLNERQVIIGMGVPTAWALEQQSLGDIEGWPHYNDKFTCTTILTHHPAYALRGAHESIVSILDSWKRASDIINGRQINYRTPKWYELQQYNDLFKHLRKLPTGHRIAVDVETNAPPDREIDVLTDPLLCAGFSWHQNYGVVAPIEIINSFFIKEWQKLVDDRPDLKWTFHNGKFDTAILRNALGLFLPIDDDTMLMSYNCDERGGIHGLKHLSMLYCGADRYELEILQYAPQKRGMGSIPRPILYKYNVFDCVYTYRLAIILEARMRKDNVERPYKELLIPAANALSKIEAHGAIVDTNYVEQLKDTYLPRIAEATATVQFEALNAGFDARNVVKSTKSPLMNPGSPKQLAALLYEDRKSV